MHVVVTASMREKVVDVVEASDIGDGRIDVSTWVHVREIHVAFSID